jgi:hypothetical protein
MGMLKIKNGRRYTTDILIKRRQECINYFSFVGNYKLITGKLAFVAKKITRQRHCIVTKVYKFKMCMYQTTELQNT